MSNKTPEWILEKARALLQKSASDFEQAKQQIPKEYQNFVIPVKETVNLAQGRFYIDEEAEKLGIYADFDGLAIFIEKPTMSMQGRIKMFCDEHLKKNKKFEIHKPEFEKIDQNLVLSVSIISEIYGVSTGIIDVNSKDSIADAQSMAIDRALSFFGIGLIGRIEPEKESTQQQHSQQQQSKQQATSTSTAPNWRYGDKQNYCEFSVTILSKPIKTPDGGVLVEKVRHPDGTITHLWFPPKYFNRGMELKVNEQLSGFHGWYDPKTNCVNLPEVFNASLIGPSAYQKVEQG